ncbi:hypothetical protein C8R44DRAFT_981620 [Mycena epipterygia]|nr:hypothetical protein C8R44DRAFT_981620 [Mycena epipterygia]
MVNFLSLAILFSAVTVGSALKVVGSTTELVAAAASTSLVRIIDILGNAFNVDLDYGDSEFVPVNSFPNGPFVGTTNSDWIMVPQSTNNSTFLLQSAFFTDLFVSYSTINIVGSELGPGRHAALLLRAKANAAVFSFQATSAAGLFNVLVPAVGQAVWSWSQGPELAGDPAAPLTLNVLSNVTTQQFTIVVREE